MLEKHVMIKKYIYYKKYLEFLYIVNINDNGRQHFFSKN
jgi:hypothetical protein